ncbi:hypothetical protein [Lysinibacillus agricola]|uniref:hypothetical protein n=1 Tax=Lysinibacillus agricola TaxID=2590012 RepID=UPI003C30A271
MTFLSVTSALLSVDLISIRHLGSSFRRFDLSFRPSVAAIHDFDGSIHDFVYSIRHLGSSFRRFDLSFRHFGSSFRRSDFYPSPRLYFPSLRRVYRSLFLLHLKENSKKGYAKVIHHLT